MRLIAVYNITLFFITHFHFFFSSPWTSPFEYHFISKPQRISIHFIVAVFLPFHTSKDLDMEEARLPDHEMEDTHLPKRPEVETDTNDLATFDMIEVAMPSCYMSPACSAGLAV